MRVAAPGAGELSHAGLPGDRIASFPEIAQDAADEEPLPKLPQGGGAALVARVARATANDVEDWKAGRDNAEADGTLALQHFLTTYAAGREPESLDPVAEARAATLLDGHQALAALGVYWAGRGGLAFAVAALAEMWNFCKRTRWPMAKWVVRAPEPAVNWETGICDCKVRMGRVIKELLDKAAPATKAEVRAQATSLRAGLAFPARICLSLAFSDTAWAHEDARALLSLDSRLTWPSRDDAYNATELVYLLRDAEVLLPFAQSFTPPLFRLVRRAGFASLPVLLDILKSPYEDKALRDEALKALSSLECLDSAKVLATMLANQTAIVREFFERRPDLGIIALAEVVAGKGKLATYAEPLLRSLLAAHPDLVPQVTLRLEAKSRAVVERECRASDTLAEASPEELPVSLVTPPWTQPKKKPAQIPLDVLPFEPKVHFTDKERAAQYGGAEDDVALLGSQRGSEVLQGIEPRTPQADALVRKMFAAGRTRVMTALLHLASDACVLELLANKAGVRYGSNSYILALTYLLARFGARALPFVLAYLELEALGPEELLRVEAVQVVPVMVGAWAKARTRPIAVEWMLTFPAAAALGLVPLALSATKKERESATAALRMLAKNHVRTVMEVAAKYGAAAAAAIDASLRVDDLPHNVPALPAFVDLAQLPRPRLRTANRALPECALRPLFTMLKLSSLADPLACLQDVKRALDPQSLAELAWKLFQAWLVSGANPKEAWAFTAVGHFGDDNCARKLTPLLRVWPGESHHARAVTGLEVLSAIGTDVALMQLQGLAQKLKFKGLQDKASEKIQLIAKARGLTSDELGDRTVPDLGLGDDGTLVLDFGPRQFTVTFDESLRPMVKDGSGKRSAELPKTGKNDDTEKAAAAVETWKALKKDARAIAARQLLRLEMVMCAERRFSKESFRAFFVEHPLMIHLVRRVVWGAYDAAGALVGTFRVAEDRSFSDAQDRSFAVAADTRVGIAHRLELCADAIAAWESVLTGHKIVQPFDQLTRAVYGLTPEEAKSNALDRMNGVTVKSSKILALESRGYRRTEQLDGMWKPLPCGVVVEVDLKGATWLATPLEQVLGRARLRCAGATEEPTFGQLSPVVFSELVRDLEGLKG